MVNGDLVFARFPVTLDLDVAADTTPQVGLVTPALFTDTQFPVLDAKVLPITGGGGKIRAVVVVFGRAVT